jgi:aryl-alcohol dehydrogenase-like predicted oxidoreductase
VQATWNLLERSAGDALAEAHDAGMSVIVKEALANGRLTERSQDPALAVLRREAEERGTSVDALALAVCLAQPFVDVVLSGAATVEHLRSNLGGAGVTAGGVAVESEPPAEYWSKRRALAWN